MPKLNTQAAVALDRANEVMDQIEAREEDGYTRTNMHEFALLFRGLAAGVSNDPIRAAIWQ